MFNWNCLFFVITMTCLLCGACEKSSVSTAADKVLQCADFTNFSGAEILQDVDSAYISGFLGSEKIDVKEGFKDYRVRFVDEEFFVLNNPTGPDSGSESRYQITFAIGQAAAAGSSFVGSPLFSISIQFPCSETLTTPAEYVRQFEAGSRIPVLGREMSCNEGAKIILRAYCFEFYENGRGFYTSTPLSSEGGKQTGNNMLFERVSTTTLPSGQVMVDIEGFFSSNLYFNTDSGSGHFFGKLTDARFRITRILGQ